MKIIGMWWNPEKAGEGFIFAQAVDADGADAEDRVIGYYFCHLNGKPMWYMLDLKWQVEDHEFVGLSGDVIAVNSNSNSKPGEPRLASEDSVGECDVLLRNDGTYDINITISANTVEYIIGPLFGTGLPMWNPQQGPAPVDPPSPPTPPPAPIAKIVQWDQLSPTEYEDIGGDPFPHNPDHNPNVVYGSIPTDINDINPRATWRRYRLTVLPHSPSIRLTAVNGSDDPRNNYNAQVVGVRRGDTLHPGDAKTVDLKLGPGASPASGWVQSSFFIDSDNGVLMNVSAQVADR